MAHVITQRCVGVKDQSCVEVCPVDCIHPASDLDGQEAFDAHPQLYIDPEVCIDCGACVPECPVEAIFYIDDLPEEYHDDIAANRDFYRTWPG
jgi:NAD-dependent dihydropyrimidine dehydrogenase PreA subunit